MLTMTTFAATAGSLLFSYFVTAKPALEVLATIGGGAKGIKVTIKGASWAGRHIVSGGGHIAKVVTVPFAPLVKKVFPDKPVETIPPDETLPTTPQELNEDDFVLVDRNDDEKMKRLFKEAQIETEQERQKIIQLAVQEALRTVLKEMSLDPNMAKAIQDRLTADQI